MPSNHSLSQPKTSLQRQMTVTLSIIIVGLLLLVSLPMVFISVQIQKRELAREQQELANQVAGTVSFIIKSIQTEQSQVTPPAQDNPRINLIASQITTEVNLTTSRVLAQIQNALAQGQPLNSIFEVNPQIQGVAQFDLNGRLIEQNLLLAPEDGVDLLSLGQTEAFDLARQGLNALDTFSIDPNTVPLLLVATPISENGGITGIAVALVDVHNTWQHLAELAVSERGYLYIIDETGNPIILPSLLSVNSIPPDMQDAIHSGQAYQGLSGNTVIGKIASIEDTPWQVVIEIPVAEANRNVRSLLIILGAILMFGVSLSISVARLFSQWVLQPIQALNQGAQRITHGDLAHRINLDRTDELGFLAATFNQMVDTLEKTIEELRSVSLRLLSAEEAERRRIAHEIHDELGQTLTALKFTASLALRKDSEDENLITLQEMAAEAQEKARTLSHELRPAMLDDLGLLPTLEWYIDRFEQRANLAISFEAKLDEAGLSPEIKTTLYRLFVEALTNIYKHAQASSVDVFLTRNDAYLHMVVTDDGQGFDTAILNTTQSLGIAGMRERINLLQGDFLLESEQNRGTKIFIVLPVENKIG